MALAEDRGFSLSRFFISLLSLLVVLSSFFHRLCDAQTEVSFDCTTLQPTGIEDAFMGSDNSDYTVTVDQPYFQQGSIRRVTVSAGDLVFTHLFLQARTQDGVVIGGWTSPLPAGYHFYFQCNSGQSIRKLGTQTNKTITFEWMPPSADTSENVFFIATFVNTQIYFIVQSDEISDPCVPSPCSVGDVCFRGSSAPGYICTGACTALTCQNGGNCSVGADGVAKCTCSEGLTGKTCETCEAHFCHNGGQCMINSAFEAQCLCMQGFGGTRCQLPREGTPCFSNPCSNGGSCRNEPDGSYTCTCMDSFAGENCETPTFCSNQPCQNGGTCVTIGASGGACNCVPGFKGGFCEEADPCHDYCFNGATCIPVTESFAICQCLSGFSGTRCQTTDDFCSLNLCRNGATCSPFLGGGGHCFCPPEYTGTTCEMPIEGEFCRQRLCENGATCLSLPGGTAGQCVCPAGYSGPYCEVNEGGTTFCSQDPCQNGGSCWDLPMGGGQCQCPSEFTGSLCEFEQGTGNCSPNFCQNGGTCTPVSETASQCQCTDLYTGPYCEILQVPSFCSFNLCMNGATCMDTDTSRGICLCQDGYQGFFCEEFSGFCALNQCMNGATCEPIGLFGGFCHCVEGFTGVRCETQGPCADNPCLNGGTCVSDNTAPSGFACQCLNSYVGTFCQYVNPCQGNSPCQNQGTCMANSDGSYTCECSQIFIGDHCETLLPCLNNPCNNGGTCSNVGETYSCSCGPAFSGPNCEIENLCILSSPCMNGGSCISTGHNTYTCQCPSDFMGQNCETNQNPCFTNRCQNGGTCTRTSLTEYSCACPSHVVGLNCDIANPCNLVPCFHGSPCTPSSDGSSYTCDCPPRLTGPNCDRQVDLCSDSPCVNGTCVSDPSVASNVRCICQDGFSGENCEILDDYCEAFKPCLNGGTCTSTGSNSDYSCECRSGYDGANCLIDLSDKPQFTGCPGVTVSFAITSNSNLANITINPRATVPETGEELSFDVIVGPLIQFPSAVMYDDIYSEGQKFMLRARDDYGRESTCSFTVRLTDQVPPTIECPDDYRDISVADTVEVSSLPLQPITRSDNIGLREAIEFSPSEVSADDRPRRITVSAYDLAGNKEECSFQLTISRRDTTCPEIPRDNGQVSCSLDGSGDRVCRLSCDDGFAAVNGEFYTCRNERWDKDPVSCAATTKPVSVAKIVSFVFPLSGSSCSGSVFLVDAAETMRNKLDELNLCRINSARACEPDSIVARCPPANGDSTRRRRRQDSGREVEIDVEVSAVVDADESVGDVESDVNSLVRNIEEAEEGLVLTFGDDTVQYSSRMSSQNFIVACPRGSVSRNGSCITCPAGSSHDEQADECSLCEAGKYQPMDGQSSCLACDPGTYQGGRGASRCDECPDNISAGESSCLTETPPFDWVMIVIYICVGIGAFLVVVIFILMVCLWRSTQEEKKQDQKRWEIGQLTQLNKSYDPEPEPGFRPRVNTTVSASTYQTVPEGDGTPNLGNGHTSGLVPIPLEELYSGIMTDSYGNMLSVGVDTHPVPHPRDQRSHHGYDYDSYHDNGFMSSSYNRRDFPI